MVADDCASGGACKVRFPGSRRSDHEHAGTRLGMLAELCNKPLQLDDCVALGFAFRAVILEPGQKYNSRCIYKFGIEK